MYNSNALCGQTVPVLTGEAFENEHFIGWCGVGDVTGDNSVIINGITGFTPDDAITGKWQHYHQDQWMLGIRTVQGVKLVVVNNGLVALNRVEPKPRQVPDNVTRLGKLRA